LALAQAICFVLQRPQLARISHARRVPREVIAAIVVAFMARSHAARASDETAPSSQAHGASNQAEVDQPPEIGPCKTDLRLSGVVDETTGSGRSFALFHVAAGRAGELYREGMSVGAYEIVAITPRAVLLRNAGGRCWLHLVGDRSARAAPAPARAARRSKTHKSEVVVIGRRR
jgi:hypothetical protein